MTDTSHEPTPPRITAQAARLVLIGAPSPLRSAVAQQLHTGTALLACLDTPAHLPQALSSPAIGAGGGLADAIVVFVTVPRPPGLVGRLRHRYRAAALAACFGQAVTAARSHGAARVVVLSTAFRYDDDCGMPLRPGSPVLTAAETGSAAAAEQAARLFTSLGGESVVLRLGWTCRREEGITRRVLSAARLGWRLIDGDPGAWVAMIAEPDAARAIMPALTVPPATYNVTDGFPITQGMLNARLETALRRELHSIDDPGWGYSGTLFGPSRRIADHTFSHLTGWHPQVGPAAQSLAAMLASYPAGRVGRRFGRDRPAPSNTASA
jgi:nucleoside-diphosphate-sugar epimerase